MKLKKIGAIVGLILLLGIGIAIAAEKTSTESWRYKMTVEVETPEGLKTGSAVREVILHKGGIKQTSEQLADVEVKGEAVVVDLGKRGVLFALIGDDYGADILFKKFPPGKPKQGEVTLDSHEYPRFVKFKNLNDPKTVEEATKVEQDGMYSYKYDLKGDVFGSGVKLKGVTIEITDEPITWNIEKIIPWLVSVKYSYLNGRHDSAGSPLGLHGGEFIKGEQ